MPTNHGIYRKLRPTSGPRITADGAMVFRYGIFRIFDALKKGPFLANPNDRQQAAQLEHHFRTLCQRFVFTLQHLNGLIQELAQSYTPGQVPPPGSMRIHFEAQCLADHVLTYLNTMVDDVAILTVLAMEFHPSKQSDKIDSMGRLRREDNKPPRDEPAFAPVSSLLVETDTPGSWWNLGFQTKTGARQLLVHNLHLVNFQLQSDPSGPMEVRGVVMSSFAQNTFAYSDFFRLLRNILSSLFDWLDRLEAALTIHLRMKSAGWFPMPTCPCFRLPVGDPPGITRYDPEYFPIPLCDGADPLPWTASVQLGENVGEETCDDPITPAVTCSGDQTLPWWIVVVNPRRQPPQPKFHSGHRTPELAVQALGVLQQKADEQATAETSQRKSEWLPFRYFAVPRPETGEVKSVKIVEPNQPPAAGCESRASRLSAWTWSHRVRLRRIWARLATLVMRR